MTKTILVVDDEQRLVSLVEQYLAQEGFRVATAFNGRQALEVARQTHPDLIVLDLMMPEMDGLAFMRAHRAENNTPIIMLTARVEDEDKIIGLELGADDYVTKPFRPRELVARVKAVLRRAGESEPSAKVLNVAGILLDRDGRTVRVEETFLDLTPSEFDILAALMTAPGRVFSRLDLLDIIQGVRYEGYERTIDTHIKNLRAKIERDSRAPRYIETVYGVGYRFARQGPMRSITTKMILAFLGIGLVSIILISMLARWNTRSEFIRFISDQYELDLVAGLSEHYQTSGSWDDAELVFLTDEKNGSSDGHPQHMPPFLLTDPQGLVLVGNGGFNEGDTISAEDLEAGTPIEVDGEIVGLLVPMPMPSFEGNPREEEFFQRTSQGLLYGAGGVALIALLLGIFLSRTISRPIRELTRATHAIAQGDLQQQVDIRSRDELGELANAFNKMSAELSRSINTRKQMTADIAHELRTPLSLILGHAEAVHDGVLQPTRENFEIIREEAERLEHLVDDLRTLSLADAGELSMQLQSVSPARLLEDLAAHYRLHTQTKDLDLQLEISNSLPDLQMDPGRITQVLTNILDNAVRHTPPGGLITLASSQTPDGVALSVRDSGPGLPPADLERIFDRFYRADESRTRTDGGSGLGLAIAKSIVQAHGGTIRAESRQGNGLMVIITLPVYPK